MAEISKINVNGTEYGIRSYIPFASTVPQKIGTFQGCDVYQIIVKLNADNLGSNTYASKTITLYNHYDILNFSGVYCKIVDSQPNYQANYYPIPEKKNLSIEIEQSYPDGSGLLVEKTDITVSCSFWDPDTAKKDTNYAYVILTLIKKTR